MSRLAALLIPLALAACADDSTPAAAPGAQLEPVVFFTGRSSGQGTLDPLVGESEPIRVQSLGRPDGRGGLILVQDIWQGDRAPHRRLWTLRPTGKTTYTGALTDARGPVAIDVDEGSAHIRYTMKNGMQVAQTLALQADGKTLLNRLDVHRFGIHIARVDETIHKLD